MSAGAYWASRACVEFLAATSSDADHRSPTITQRAGRLMRSCRGMGRTCTRCSRGCPPQPSRLNSQGSTVKICRALLKHSVDADALDTPFRIYQKNVRCDRPGAPQPASELRPERKRPRTRNQRGSKHGIELRSRERDRGASHISTVEQVPC